MPAELRRPYSADLDISRLETQLRLLPAVINGGQACEQATVQDIVKAVQSASDSGGEVFRRMVGEVITPLKIYFTVPVATVTAVRTFSTLRHTKTYLRTTMGQVPIHTYGMFQGNNYNKTNIF